MIIIGCDYHPGFQQIAFVDTETGDYGEQRSERTDGLSLRINHRKNGAISVREAADCRLSPPRALTPNTPRSDDWAILRSKGVRCCASCW